MKRVIAISIALLVCTTAKSLAVVSSIKGVVEINKPEGGLIEDRSRVVVFLDKVDAKSWPKDAKAKIFSMSSKERQFVPDVLPVLMDSTVEFPNEDPILHNVFSLSKINKFDLGLYKKGQKHEKVTFGKPGMVKVYCNIHEEMVGHIIVMSNPFFTTTDKKGGFEIKDVPPGTYNLVAWYRFSTEQQSKDIVLTQTQKVEVNGKEVANAVIPLNFVQNNTSTKHTNKWGQEYKKTY